MSADIQHRSTPERPISFQKTRLDLAIELWDNKELWEVQMRRKIIEEGRRNSRVLRKAFLLFIY